MQVLDILEEYEGQKIRLGAVNGSCFFWIGRVNEDTSAELMQIWKDYKRHFDNRINMFGARLEKALMLEEYYRQNPSDFPRQLLEIDELKKKFNEAKTQREACINPLKREVVDVYPSIAEDDTLIFLVDGYETGRAWTLDEWGDKHDR